MNIYKIMPYGYVTISYEYTPSITIVEALTQTLRCNYQALEAFLAGIEHPIHFVSLFLSCKTLYKWLTAENSQIDIPGVVLRYFYPYLNGFEIRKRYRRVPIGGAKQKFSLLQHLTFATLPLDLKLRQFAKKNIDSDAMWAHSSDCDRYLNDIVVRKYDAGHPGYAEKEFGCIKVGFKNDRHWFLQITTPFDASEDFLLETSRVDNTYKDICDPGSFLYIVVRTEKDPNIIYSVIVNIDYVKTQKSHLVVNLLQLGAEKGISKKEWVFESPNQCMVRKLVFPKVELDDLCFDFEKNLNRRWFTLNTNSHTIVTCNLETGEKITCTFDGKPQLCQRLLRPEIPFSAAYYDTDFHIRLNGEFWKPSVAGRRRMAKKILLPFRSTFERAVKL